MHILDGRDWPVFGIAVDFGSVVNTTVSPVWAIGIVRNPVVQYTGTNGQIQNRSSYYWSAYSTIQEVVSVMYFCWHVYF